MDFVDGRGVGLVGSLLIVGALGLLVAACGGSSSSPTTPRSTTAAFAGGSGHAGAGRVPEVRVPELVGERFGAAVRQVERVGLNQTAPHFTGTVGNPHYNGHCQKILNQSPPAGTKVPKGYTVSLVYGVCPKAIQHPRRQPRG